MPLKVLHIPYTYYPDAVGGTEIYVEQLAQHLASWTDNVIAAPGAEAQEYEHRGVRVYRIPVTDKIQKLEELYNEGDARAAQFVGGLLDRERIDVLHLHALTRIVSPRVVAQAHQRGVPVVFTYHTPTVSCLRSGLMLWGARACDGVLETDRCTRCRLHSLGLPRPAADLIGRAPRPLRALAAAHQGGVWTALRMHDLVQQHHAVCFQFMAQVERVVVLCDWTRRVLLKNRVPAEKIVYVPHGLTVDAPLPPRQPGTANTLRLIALGRLEATKGMDLLVAAMRQLPELPIRLDIYGIVQSAAETSYARALRAAIARDARIQLKPPVPHARVLALLQEYDALVIPSRWLETGPLVVLEAFAVGVPVIGSDLGGIQEKVQHGVNGLLVPLQVQAWADTLQRIATDPALLAQLRAGVQPPRPMSQVAEEMCAVYAQVGARMAEAPA